MATPRYGLAEIYSAKDQSFTPLDSIDWEQFNRGMGQQYVDSANQAFQRTKDVASRDAMARQKELQRQHEQWQAEQDLLRPPPPEPSQQPTQPTAPQTPVVPELQKQIDDTIAQMNQQTQSMLSNSANQIQQFMQQSQANQQAVQAAIAKVNAQTQQYAQMPQYNIPPVQVAPLPPPVPLQPPPQAPPVVQPPPQQAAYPPVVTAASGRTRPSPAIPRQPEMFMGVPKPVFDEMSFAIGAFFQPTAVLEQTFGKPTAVALEQYKNTRLFPAVQAAYMQSGGDSNVVTQVMSQIMNQDAQHIMALMGMDYNMAAQYDWSQAQPYILNQHVIAQASNPTAFRDVNGKWVST